MGFIVHKVNEAKFNSLAKKNEFLMNITLLRTGDSMGSGILSFKLQK